MPLASNRKRSKYTTPAWVIARQAEQAAIQARRVAWRNQCDFCSRVLDASTAGCSLSYDGGPVCMKCTEEVDEISWMKWESMPESYFDNTRFNRNFV